MSGVCIFGEVAGAWFSGLATLAAVILSLVLARRDRIQLRISAGHRITVGPGAIEPYPNFLFIQVRNVGNRMAKIDGIAWRKRPWLKLHGNATVSSNGRISGATRDNRAGRLPHVRAAAR